VQLPTLDERRVMARHFAEGKASSIEVDQDSERIAPLRTT